MSSLEEGVSYFIVDSETPVFVDSTKTLDTTSSVAEVLAPISINTTSTVVLDSTTTQDQEGCEPVSGARFVNEPQKVNSFKYICIYSYFNVYYRVLWHLTSTPDLTQMRSATGTYSSCLAKVSGGIIYILCVF